MENNQLTFDFQCYFSYILKGNSKINTCPVLTSSLSFGPVLSSSATTYDNPKCIETLEIAFKDSVLKYVPQT